MKCQHVKGTGLLDLHRRCMIHSDVRSTRAINKWMSFARPSYGKHIADMELLTVHGGSKPEIELFWIFRKRDRGKHLARWILYFNQFALMSLMLNVRMNEVKGEREDEGTHKAIEPPATINS
jgi:hypothetical protein